jgi:hypothetical protein
MHQLVVTQYPIYLPADVAQLPFGDPLSDITVTSASPGVVTAPGYRNVTNGDQVGFSTYNTSTTNGSMPTPLTAGTRYYVVSASNNTFSVSSTSNGSPIATTSTGSQLTLHLLSQQNYGTKRPFKPGGNALAINASSSAVVLQGASDVNAAIGSYGNPGGPGTYSVIASVSAGTAQIVQLTDWISLTSGGTLILLQN